VLCLKPLTEVLFLEHVWTLLLLLLLTLPLLMMFLLLLLTSALLLLSERHAGIQKEQAQKQK